MTFRVSGITSGITYHEFGHSGTFSGISGVTFKKNKNKKKIFHNFYLLGFSENIARATFNEKILIYHFS